MGHGYANCCEVCDSQTPDWYVTRHGDAVVSWACDDHVVEVLKRLRRKERPRENTVFTVQMTWHAALLEAMK